MYKSWITIDGETDCMILPEGVLIRTTRFGMTEDSPPAAAMQYVPGIGPDIESTLDADGNKFDIITGFSIRQDI